MSEYQSVLQTPDVGPGQVREVEVRGEAILVFNVGQRYYAMQARCPQSGDSLELRPRHGETRIVCPGDDAEYTLPHGARVRGSGPDLRRYDIRIEGNRIQVGPPLE